ncbi:uncharacterized protein LOC103838272 [Brassica rapa]|uniref:uncharacterized protein LOC103838272 n=1 Tax=Brassica campestris TaxID=3711 RepID=UPI00142D5DA2|nr:uncharacterized protein LOC103838272 [Brassica rapa]
MRIYALIPKLSSDSVAFIGLRLSLSLLFFSRPHRPSPIRKLYPGADLIVATELLSRKRMCRQNCCAKSSQEEEVISPPDENLLIYCKPVRLYNILRIRSLFNPSFLPRLLS